MRERRLFLCYNLVENLIVICFPFCLKYCLEIALSTKSFLKHLSCNLQIPKSVSGWELVDFLSPFWDNQNDMEYNVT